MKPVSGPTDPTTATRPCGAGDRLLYLGYLLAGTLAIALTTLAVGEENLHLALRGASALLAAGLLRRYLLQSGQFNACADSLEPADDGLPHAL